MKKSIVYLVVAGIALSATELNASTIKISDSSHTIPTSIQPTALTKDGNAVKKEALLVRLLEIKNMDKSNLTAGQKKMLRKEVRAISKEKVHGGGGIYLSLSAIVIVLLLLVILL
jgi:hypothetical protein